MKKEILVFFLILFVLKIKSQDVLLKRDGEEIQTKIIEVNETQVKYKRFDYLTGPTITISKDLVFYIKYENGKKEVFKTSDGNNYQKAQNYNVPLIEPFDSPNFKIFGNYIPKGEFAKTNPDFSTSGKYFYNNATGFNGTNCYKNYSFNYSNLPAKYIEKNENLNENSFRLNNINVLFSGFIPLEYDYIGRTNYYQKAYSKFKLDNPENFDVPKNSNEVSLEIDAKFKSVITEIMKSKNCNNYSIFGLNDISYSKNENFSNSITLEFKVVDLDYFSHKKDRNNWPDYVIYQLNIITPKGNIISSYNQMIFFESEIKGKMNKMGLYVYQYLKSSFNVACSSLINQYLNDKLISNKWNENKINQSNAVPEELNHDFSKIQAKFFEFNQNKKRIADELAILGFKIERISYGETIDPNSVQVYNSSATSQTNQLATDFGQFAVGIANVVAANKERKELQMQQLNIGKLKIEYEKIDIEEIEYTKTIALEILNSPAVYYLPNNKEINKYITTVLYDLNNKVTNTSTLINSKNAKISEDFNSLNSQLKTQQQTQISVESSAVTAKDEQGFNKNVAAAKQCSAKTSAYWKTTPVYKNFERNRGCSKMSYKAQLLLAELMLKDCGEFLPQAEKEGYNKAISYFENLIANTPECQDRSYGK